VSRYFHRITRAEQVPDALLQAMRILTDPAETGAVTLALPQDVQAEAWDVPDGLLDERMWHVGRPRPEPDALARAAAMIASAKRPLIVAGGGVRYSDASGALGDFSTRFGVPVAETQAGKGSLPFDHPFNLGAIGSTGTSAANETAEAADVVIGIGTRWSDFTTASRTVFANEEVRFINVNIAAFDAVKQGGAMVVADAQSALVDLAEALAEIGWAGTSAPVRSQISNAAAVTQREITAFTSPRESRDDGLISQAEAIGAVRSAVGESGIVVCAAGSLPGDLHRLWQASDPASYHVEYGFSCMGYEIAGAIGAQLAEPDRQVVAMVGDGSWLMLSSELTTAVQEQIPVTVVLIDNHGYGSIGALSASLGSDGFGTRHRYRGKDGDLSGEALPIDYEAMARAYGAHAQSVGSVEELHHAVTAARERQAPSVIVVRTHADGPPTPGGYWWDVPVAQVSERNGVVQAGGEQVHGLKMQRTYL
jgi:3D-(3,5/4)-trihydroxycyclohexane-1,2-dione acylhydrolase (decyclizing)